MRALSVCAAGILLLQLGTVHSQERGPCWEIIAPTQNISPFASMLLDRCTGKSWLMVRERISGSKPASFSYRWAPLSSSESGEAVFLENPPPPPILLPKASTN